jgi:hypothetical protein
MRRPLIAAAALALGLMLSGCESFELPDMPDWFNPKKPLVGERKAVFPEGVPGVQKGVPPDLQQGYQPPPESSPQTAEVVEKPKPKAKPKPKPKQAAAPPPSHAATSVTIQPASRQQQPANDPAFPPPPSAGPQSTWPTPQQTASQPAPAQSPFPPPPPPR